ncbi:MAG TPA: arabinan endo-1,5-alpha-L-arabinosidase [Solirubrobacteraceae bacterium]
MAGENRRARAVAFACTVVVTVCAIGAPTAAAYPNPGRVAGYTVVHDPAMLIKPATGDAPRYTVFGTHNTAAFSNDRIAFSSAGKFFPVIPAWWKTVRADEDVWAPDISFHNGKYWLYYSISSGSNHTSKIGLATSATGLPGTFTDEGPIFSSNSSTDYNAIDPNLLVDAQGRWWMTFGSFWGGIFMFELNPATGKPAASPPTLHHLAERPRTNPGPTVAGPGIEGAFVYRKGAYYYLFASFDRCCRGVTSNYNIRVGRSTSPTGPYADAGGVSMLDGGGTKILETHGYVIGPGGQSVYGDDYFGYHDLLVYHYYHRDLNGLPFLGINFLDFSSGFPRVY